jgi:hypothetical protein
MADINVDIDIDDFLWGCNTREIKEVIEWLQDEGHLDNEEDQNHIPSNKQNVFDTEWYSLCDKLSRIRLQLNHEDEKIIKEILKKYY